MPGRRRKGLNPRQKKLTSLLPKVEAGEMTKKQAMLQAGYAESSANQQQQVLGAIRNNTKMQEALRKAGFTEEYLAEGVVEGTGATTQTPHGYQADYRARGIFYKLGAELLDAFPAAKNLHGIVDPESLLDKVESEGESVPWSIPEK